jgi:hypothetical protein
MAALDFPNSPTNGQVYAAANGASYQWSTTGSRWLPYPAVAGPYLPTAGGTMTGDIVLAADANAGLEPTTLQQMQAADTVSVRAAMSAEDNLLINGSMEIWQRGTSFPLTAAAAAYTADRWQASVGAGNTATVSQASIGLGTDSAAGDPVWTACKVDRTVTVSDNSYLVQFIENVRTAQGSTVAISFDVYSTKSGGSYLYAAVGQSFGTGGSPSARVEVGTYVTINQVNTWERKTLTLAVPSIAGKTLGTNLNDYLYLSFAVLQAFGVGTMYFANVDLRLGTVSPAQYLRRPLQQELALCQRYYQTLVNVIMSGNTATGTNFYTSFVYPVTMRAAPTVTFANITYSNTSALAVNGTTTVGQVRLMTTITAAGFGFTSSDLRMDAEL